MAAARLDETLPEDAAGDRDNLGAAWATPDRY